MLHSQRLLGRIMKEVIMSKKWYFWLNCAILIAISLNLRAPINVLGPMIESIREHYGISSAMFGFLSAIPIIAFGSVSFIVSYFSDIKILFSALCAVVLGEIGRSYGGITGLFLGTAFIGAGVAVANVLLPSFVKKKFPKHTTAMMALYSFVLNLSSVMGIWLALPLTYSIGVPHTLAFWLIFSILALMLYFPEIRNNRISRVKIRHKHTKSLMREIGAWKITIFMGLQGFLAYSTFAWLPAIIAQKGYGLEYGTKVLLYSQFVCVPVAFFGPLLLGVLREKHKSLYMAFLCSLYVVGYLCVLLGESQWTIYVAIVCIGAPMGGVFGLALLFISQKSSSVMVATKLSAMVQGFGYLIAASGPFAIGLLHDHFESYTYGIVIALCVAVALNITGILAHRTKMIG